MDTILEIAQKILEYEHGIGMLSHTCHVSAKDECVKTPRSNVARMDCALGVSEERKGLTLMKWRER